MAHRIGEHVIAGEIFNTRRHSTHGYLLLKGWESMMAFELTGDARESLAGRHIRFQVTDPDAERPPHNPRELVLRHIGAVGDIELRMNKIPTVDMPLLEALEKRVDLKPVWLPVLYIEWYSQNGRVVTELVDPMIEVREGPPIVQPKIPEDSGHRGGLTVVRFDLTKGMTFRNFFESEDDDEDDDTPPFDIAKADEEDDDEEPLDDYLEALNAKRDAAIRESAEAAEDEMDEDTRRFIEETKLMDRLMTEEPGEPLGSLLEPRSLPHPESLDEAAAEAQVMGLLVEMALMGVQLHMCEHFTYKQAYQFLVDEVFPEMRVHPELKGTGWVQSHDTSEACPECEREAEERYQEYERERAARRERGEDPDGIAEDGEDLPF